MKIERLIGVLSILLQQDKVTAPYLAEKFEVSRRTINRDIEALCQAGIPIVTTQGQNGGISIMEGYKIDKTLLTSGDMQAILAGLRSLDSVSGTNRYQQLMDKLSVGNSSILTNNNHILIDLSSWYKTTLAPKIELIQDAIEQQQYIAFDYYGPCGEGRRKIEPYLLIFQWASWYVWGFCTQRGDYRLFKLNRIQELHRSEERFKRREVPQYETSPPNVFPVQFQATVLCESEMKWRLIEEYGIESFREREDGKLYFQFGFADKENLFGWLLSFGDMAELLEPQELRRDFAQIVEGLSQKYKH